MNIKRLLHLPRSLSPLSFTVLAAVLVSGVPSSCSNSDSQGSGGSGGTGTGGTGGTVQDFGDSACGKCIESICSDDITTCKADPECNAYQECLFKCPTAPGGTDDSCAKKCEKASTSEGAMAEANVEACRTIGDGKKKCGDACDFNTMTAPDDPLLNQMCSGPVGGSGGGGGETPDMKMCHICEAEKCCKTEAACEANPDCKKLGDCDKACVNATGDHTHCQADCAAMFPNGVADFGASIGCVGYRCLSSCDGGTADSCVTCSYTGDCGALYAHILATVDGYLLTSCVAKCNGDLDCVDGCFKTYPDQTTAIEEYTDCLSLECPQCG